MYKYSLKGSIPTTRKYILKSNFNSSIKYGFARYLYTTKLSPCGISYGLLIKKIPLPWHAASGLTINVFLYFELNYLFKSLKSAGTIQVLGKKLYEGNFFRILISYFPRLFFLERENMPGQWFIF